MIRKLLVAVAVLIALLAVTLVLVARGAIGGDTLRRTLEQQLSASLKQTVTIGRLGASFYPRVALDLHDIRIGQPAGATIAELSIATGLRGLLSRRVEEAEVVVSNSRVPVAVAVAIAGTATSGQPAGSSGGGLTIVSVRTLAFRHVEVVADTRSLVVDLESSLAGDRLDVARLSAESAGTRLEASGAITSLARHQGTFTASASQLNLDELLAVASSLSMPSSSPSTAPAQPDAAGAPPLDVTLKLTAPIGQLGGYAFRSLSTTLLIKSSALRLEPLRFSVFGGAYDGRITVAMDGAAAPRIGLDGRLDGMDMLTILKETRGTSSMSGKLSGTVALTTRGASSSEMLAAARGSGRVTIANGAIPGLEMVRAVVLAFGKPSGAAAASSGSAFSRIDAAFSLADQTLRSPDLSFASADFDMHGAPTVRLPNGEVDMRADVSLSPELTAQAGTDLRRYAQEDGRIVVPAVVSGTVAAPSVTVDVRAAAGRALQNEMKRRVKGLFDRLIK